MNKWVSPEILDFYRETGVIDDTNFVTPNYQEKLEQLTSEKVRELKKSGRAILNTVLKNRPDQNGNILRFSDDDFIFDFKRRFVNYKRPDLPFHDPVRLKNILQKPKVQEVLHCFR